MDGFRQQGGQRGGRLSLAALGCLFSMTAMCPDPKATYQGGQEQTSGHVEIHTVAFSFLKQRGSVRTCPLSARHGEAL